MPWTEGQRAPYYMGFLTPGSPNGVTVGFTEIKDRISAFASFHDNVADPAAVEAVLELVCTQPVSLLEEHRLQAMDRLTVKKEVVL